MKLSAKSISAILVACVIAAPVSASAADWKLLGKRNVKERVETDVISLRGHRGYKKIKICVYRNPVSFKDLDVYYENGGHQDINIAKRINPGNCTRAIDLRGERRDLDRIVMRYEETSRRKASATVRVYGK